MTHLKLGQLLDHYIENEMKSSQSIESVYLFKPPYSGPQIVLNFSESDYDYTEIFFEIKNLSDEKAALELSVKTAQEKLRKLQKSQRGIEKAIKLLKGDL